MNYVEKHLHNGLDSPPINLSDSHIKIATSIPTKQEKEGTMLLYWNGSTYRIYFMINQTWKYVNLS